MRAVDWLDRLPSIRVPTLVIAGARDVGATPAMAQAIAERIPGAQLRVFDDASHLSVAEVPATWFQNTIDITERRRDCLRRIVAYRCVIDGGIEASIGEWKPLGEISLHELAL